MQQELSIGLEIMRVSTLIRRHADKIMENNGSQNVTGSNGWILSFLYENEGRDIFQRDLETSFSITRSTVSKVVKLMESKGLIRRETVFHDGRLKKLVLTDLGRQIYQCVAEGNAQLEKQIVFGLSAEEIQQLTSLLRKVASNLEEG